jgi:hypothetical protein
MALHALVYGGERERETASGDSHVLLDELVDKDGAARTVECAYDFLQEQLCRLDPSAGTRRGGGCSRHDQGAMPCLPLVRVGGLSVESASESSE